VCIADERRDASVNFFED